jgi:hypothetical protein
MSAWNIASKPFFTDIYMERVQDTAQVNTNIAPS